MSNYQKYLKYKKKYLDLQIQKGGYFILKDNGFNKFSLNFDIFNELNLLLKSKFNFEMDKNRTIINNTFLKTPYFKNLNIYYKFGNIKSDNKIIFNSLDISKLRNNLEYHLDCYIILLNTKAIITRNRDNFELFINTNFDKQIGGSTTYSIDILTAIVIDSKFKKKAQTNPRLNTILNITNKYKSKILGGSSIFDYSDLDLDDDGFKSDNIGYGAGAGAGADSDAGSNVDLGADFGNIIDKEKMREERDKIIQRLYEMREEITEEFYLEKNHNEFVDKIVKEYIILMKKIEYFDNILYDFNNKLIEEYKNLNVPLNDVYEMNYEIDYNDAFSKIYDDYIYLDYTDDVYRDDGYIDDGYRDEKIKNPFTEFFDSIKPDFEKNKRILNELYNKERLNPKHHIFNNSLIDKNKTINELKINPLLVLNNHGKLIDGSITLEPGQKIICLKYFTFSYSFLKNIKQFEVKLFKENKAFDNLTYLSNLSNLKLGGYEEYDVFKHKYAIYDGNIAESRVISNMVFSPLEQRLLTSNENISRLTKKVPISNVRYNELYHLLGGLYQAPILFTNFKNKEKLNLDKIFKKDIIDIKELNKHRQLFSDPTNNKINLHGRSDILEYNYTTNNYYKPASKFDKKNTLKHILDDLKCNGIDKFTLIIFACQNINLSKDISEYKYFDLNQYMNHLSQTT